MTNTLVDTHVYLPHELHERLRRYAYKQEISQAETIRRALDDYLPRLPKIKEKPGK